MAEPPLWLSVAAFASSFDRFVVGPLLVVVATDLDASLHQTVGIASGYFLAYGLFQPLWGVLSDRLGRVRVMRGTLAAAALSGVLSALAPSLTVLVVARVLAGAFFGAIVPTSLTYVGDTVPEAHRQRALSDLMAVIAVGTAVATAVAGGVAQWVGWRPVFVVPAVVALVCAVGLRALPEPSAVTVAGVGPTIRLALANRWVLVVGLLAFVEGGLVLGVLTLFAPALQSQGVDAATAGLATAAYGGSVIVASRAVKALAARFSRLTMMGIGGAALAVGYGALATYLSVAAVVLAALLLGITWAFLHSSLQTWATSVVPRARGTGVALFATCLFVGSSVGATAAGPLAERGHWSLLFALAAGTGVALAVAAAQAYRVYARQA